MPDKADDTYPNIHSTPGLFNDINLAIQVRPSPSPVMEKFLGSIGALRGIFNYSYVEGKTHNATEVRNELLNKRRPVLMYGQQSTNIERAWVCDGVQDLIAGPDLYFAELLFFSWNGYYYSNGNLGISPTNPGTLPANNTNVASFFHMNWGWENVSNGWFLAHSAWVNGNNFQNQRWNIFINPN
jgi:hypothetical protein